MSTVGYFSNSQNAELSDKDFSRLSELIMTRFGIKMPPEKKIMLQSRLQRRLRALAMNSYEDYVKYLFSPRGMSEEIIHMMDVVSTNKTDFFRESAHFEYLLSDALPALTGKQGIRGLNIWSAGSSSGEEAYTIGITLMEYKKTHSIFDFMITGSDISTKMLEKAYHGIYEAERVAEIPFELLKKYFLKSKDPAVNKVRVIPELRRRLKLYRQNLLELPVVSQPEFHIVFCRNVLIYFDRKNQETILSRICSNLRKDGYLFLGHSESITGYDLPLEQLRPTIFRKK